MNVLRDGERFISFLLTYRRRRGSQAADGGGTVHEGVCEREEQHQKQQESHQVREEQSRTVRVVQGGADVRQALAVTERMAQDWTRNVTFRNTGQHI